MRKVLVNREGTFGDNLEYELLLQDNVNLQIGEELQCRFCNHYVYGDNCKALFDDYDCPVIIKELE